MVGVVMSFNDYQVTKGLAGIFTSPWVGLKHFKALFTSFYFYDIMRNTILISVYKILFAFTSPIIFALLLNELRGRRFKRVVQTITYLPNFFSPVVIVGLILSLISPNYGIINALIGSMGGAPSNFLANPRLFRSIIVFIDVWQGTGFSAIIYLAAITSIDQEQYESAKLDGANRFKQIWHITLPGMSDIIILLFIFRIGYMLNAGFDQIFLLYSPPVYPVGDIIDTFVYREGLVHMSYSFSTAVGLFKSVIGFALIVAVNKAVKKFGRQGIW